MSTIVDYHTAEDLARAARARQRQLADALPPPLCFEPRWKLAQQGHIPTLSKIREQLLEPRP